MSESPTKYCHAMTTAGTRCRRKAVPGLTVCRMHGGATLSSRRSSVESQAKSQISVLWGLDSGGSSAVNAKEELATLIRNKRRDITAIRATIEEDPSTYYGMLPDTQEIVHTSTMDGSGGSRVKRATRKQQIHPLVGELHKAEMELLRMLRLLTEVEGSSELQDTQMLQRQAARQAARIMRAYPGISVEDVAKEVSRAP